MASVIAKRLLQGERIIIVNAEKAVISGKRRSVIEGRKKFLKVGHPWKGPSHPRRPDQIVRRTVRGMLPYRQPKGSQAYRRLRVYVGVPKEFASVIVGTIPEASADKLKCPYVTIEELSKEVG